MDSNVIQFPTRAVRDWIVLERAIRQILERSGTSPQMAEEICVRMKEAYPKFAEFKIAYQLPPMPEGLRATVENSLSKALKEFADELHEYTNELIFERLQLEVELYKLRHNEPENA